MQLNVDAYNATNASSIRAINTTYGPRWRNVNALLDPRIVVFSGVIRF